jgi:hypothetical protein
MGDGNHSLATAKAIWEETKKSAAPGADTMADPARHALVEIVNVHDAALVFEPIHRVVFEMQEGRDLTGEMKSHYGERFGFRQVDSLEAVKQAVDARKTGVHEIGVIQSDGFGILSVSNPDSNLPVGSLQLFLDKFLESGGANKIDYVHGTDPLLKLGREKQNMGFYLPAMNKGDLFKTVILDGALPRKTFSMGEAEEKRFYMECRRLDQSP